MIEIKEGKSKKLPCLYSLFFSLPDYNARVFDVLIQSEYSAYDKKTGIFEFSVNSIVFILNTLCSYYDVSITPLKEKVAKSEKVGNHKFKVKPYKHQLEGIEYGLNHKKWLLLDDTGLGKTMTVIYLAETLKKQGLKHCLIVCAVSSLKYNWEAEIKKSSNLSYRILGDRITRSGRHSAGTVASRIKELSDGVKEFFIITNIETIRDKGFYKAFAKHKNDIGMIVLDEAHRCKDPSSQSAKGLMKIQAEHMVAMTGTLIVNVPENSYVPLKWTDNTSATFSAFKHMYNQYGGFGGVQVIGHKNLSLLQELVSSCSLRRLKDDVLDLPPKTYLKEYVEMSASQRALYDEVAEGIALELDKLDHIPTVMEELAINTRLRQITAYPGMLSTTVTNSAKLDRLVELVDDITSQGDKVVVLGTFKQAVYEAEKRLEKYNPVVCTGDTDDPEIEWNKQKFENDKTCKVFLGTWQKMGTGHTLSSANYLIFIDTPWTDSDFQQASDRIYRIGQKKPCFIITLITVDSYDERVVEIVERKECLSRYLVDNDEEKKKFLNILGENSQP